MVEARRKQVEENADKYPPGLLEQYKIQLEYLADKNIPDFELMIFPFIFGDVPRPPDPSKPYIAVISELAHPFARGTIVSAYWISRSHADTFVAHRIS